MAGRTGKRAKPPGICITCGKLIRGVATFMRDRGRDEHEECWIKRIKPVRTPPPERDMEVRAK